MFDLPIAALLARDAVTRKLHDAPRSPKPAAHRPVRRKAAGTLRGLADRLDSAANPA
jgi:hypothetical protein